jgi:DNA-nicking Smr family endonuclease
MSRRRQLSDEEQTLWSGYARSITPLRRAAPAQKPPAADKTKPPAPAKALDVPIAAAPPPAKPARPAPLVPLGRRLKQRVARGREEIDARIDLHGMTQARAHQALFNFLRRAQADGARIALVVTGKGVSRSERGADSERGVLKRQVPLWLSLPEFRSLIVGFDDAHVGHGGQGALYVRLRRGH